MMQVWKAFLVLGIVQFLFPISAAAEIWFDEDGESAVVFDGSALSIYSIGDFYYFDQLFGAARNGTKLRVCIDNDRGAGRAVECLGFHPVSVGFDNGGHTRSLHFDIESMEIVFEVFEGFILEGETMKISIDDNDLFAAYTLHKENKLTERAREQLKIE